MVTAFIPLVCIVSLVFYVIVGRKFQRADETEGELTALVQENLTGVRVVRAFGRERYEIDRFNKKNEEFTNMWVNLGKSMGINWGLGDVSAGFQVLVIIVVGVFFVEAGNLTAGEFLAFTAYNSMLVWPARNLGRLLSELSKTSISATRLFDLLDAKEAQDSPGAKTPPLTGDIVFHHVSFGYSPASGVAGSYTHLDVYKRQAVLPGHQHPAGVRKPLPALLSHVLPPLAEREPERKTPPFQALWYLMV